MSSWLTIARAQARASGRTVAAGEGSVVSQTARDVVVELRDLQGRAMIAIFDRTTGRWLFTDR